MSIRSVDIIIHTCRNFNSQPIKRKMKFNKYLPCDIRNAHSNVAGDVMMCHWMCRSQQSEEAWWPHLQGPAVHEDCRSTRITLNTGLYTPHSEHRAVHTPLWTQGCTHPTLNTGLCTPHSEHRAVHTPLWTQGCTHPTLNTGLYTPHSEHRAVHTPLWTQGCTCPTLNTGLYTPHYTWI